MATAKNPLKIVGAPSKDAGSQELVLKESSNEFFFAVVGHAGSGTSVIAESLQDLLRQTSIGTEKIEVEILKARTVIEAWARKKKLSLPAPGGAKTLSDVELLQDYGDQMRAELCGDTPDHAAVAHELVLSMDCWRQDPAARETCRGTALPTQDETRSPPPILSIAETFLAMGSDSYLGSGAVGNLGTTWEQTLTNTVHRKMLDEPTT